MRFALLLITFSLILYAKLNVVVTITPQSFILQSIAKDKITISTLIPKNQSPHHYEPKISTMQKISKANFYFTIGVEFEKEWLQRIKTQNPNLTIIPCDKNITKLNNNPHIWLSPKNIVKIALCMASTLKKYDPKNALFYQNNSIAFIEKVNKYDKKIQKIINSLHNKKFIDIHPAWSYFAAYYNLKEYTIEIEGKSVVAKHLMKLINFAKENNIKAIFVQPEFSPKAAQIIANEVGANVVTISPLEANILENLLYFAKNLQKANNVK